VKNCKLNVGKDLQFIDLNMKNALNRWSVCCLAFVLCFLGGKSF
jgi:hypothetical protein